ncbi:hypothetical protein LY78DRAFT_38144 [Colletotrichum sublineola]|nr:hypothetical protein LY78DRAFT_38144 [Colletotrichum sublineola]
MDGYLPRVNRHGTPGTTTTSLASSWSQSCSNENNDGDVSRSWQKGHPVMCYEETTPAKVPSDAGRQGTEKLSIGTTLDLTDYQIDRNRTS